MKDYRYFFLAFVALMLTVCSNSYLPQEDTTTPFDDESKNTHNDSTKGGDVDAEITPWETISDSITIPEDEQ